MTNSIVLRDRGLRTLVENLGAVEAEQFIALIKRESFDYTTWQRQLYGDMPLEDFLQKAARFRQAQEKTPVNDSI
jgi:hypothetical protein